MWLCRICYTRIAGHLSQNQGCELECPVSQRRRQCPCTSYAPTFHWASLSLHVTSYSVWLLLCQQSSWGNWKMRLALTIWPVFPPHRTINCEPGWSFLTFTFLCLFIWTLSTHLMALHIWGLGSFCVMCKKKQTKGPRLPSLSLPA